MNLLLYYVFTTFPPDKRRGSHSSWVLVGCHEATPNLDAVDRALEELQRGLLEIDHVLVSWARFDNSWAGKSSGILRQY